MEINRLKPKKALNKAFLKVKPNRNEIENFKANLTQLLDRKNETESEEFHKNLVIDFLKKTYYEPDHYINTKGRNDLVIHNGNKAKSSVGVIVEAKKPTNKSEMKNKHSERDDVFPKAKIGQCRALPIKNIPIDKQQSPVQKVNKILLLKKENSTADTSSLEAEIDQLAL